MNHLPLCFVFLFLILLIFFSRKEGLVTNIDEEITVPVMTKDLVVRIQINSQVLSGDAWINLGDITLRDRDGNQIYYGNTNNVYLGDRSNWPGWPVQHLWDNDKNSGAHSSPGRPVENLIINLNPVALGSVQITNSHHCCEWRIGNYELAIYNYKNDKIGSIKLDRVATQTSKTVLYKMSYPK